MPRQYGKWFVKTRLREQGFILISDFKIIQGSDKIEYICKKCGKRKKVLLSSALKGIKCGHSRVPHTKEKEKLRSKGYVQWRDEVKFRYEHKSAKSGETDFLVVHHILSIQTHKDLILCPWNGIVLTEPEHAEFHKEYGDNPTIRDTVSY